MYLKQKRTKFERLSLVLVCVFIFIAENGANTVSHESTNPNIAGHGDSSSHALTTNPPAGHVDGKAKDQSNSHSGNHVKSTEVGEHSVERFPAVVLDFARVQTPFIISMWIFCACLGKIGK